MAGDCKAGDCKGGDCKGGDCIDLSSAATSNGLPYLILIVTLVLCCILLATLALIIIVVVTRHRRKRLDSLDTAISYDDLAKPGMTAMEVQPDMRTLGDHRGFMPYAPYPTRRFVPQAQFDPQRRLIPVPEEEGSADEGRHSKGSIPKYPAYDYNNGNLGDADGEDDLDGDEETLQGASAAPLRHVRQTGYNRSKQGTQSNSGT